ncbi:Transcription mediator subunit Med12 [Venustampulla echinocandica]|uniref:Mediator of RNA polymerase II transcription subunit 12 n=1 Tax=Venustampulla echinocandica TaxID=2656787 RepID=A0A370TBU5_9HELO|nr:Transcription mediator subunit Med12 [Venustampulla echinocandica]RDL31522.1 Transcription mediator subunit Med12 [Venustampulla echinocandica]
MTTRPPLGQRQPPQRSLSATNAVQRPPANHRSLPQQSSSSSPTRRGNETFVDLTYDGADPVGGRYGAATTVPRNGGSRLKLEISDSGTDSQAESPKPAPDVAPIWRPSAPPRGRPRTHFDVLNASSLGFRAGQDGLQGDAQVKPMPLPVRPRQHAPPVSGGKLLEKSGSPARKDGRPKPYTLEVPPAAPRYPPNGHVDFYPWTGNHPEDHFSESVIRQGYYDKAQMSQNETGSAKSTVFPALKNKTGLQTLSSILTSVLAQRKAHGQITASSTFKPPPRVTVTDTKREMWLKDLANPTISLRRLSRSIPHGIRGKVLLDQSLSKNIPIERAIWLAKCVGANELRSFRRKGVSGTFAMGGEAKWIRDFTVCVEQFIESILGTCGEGDFKTKIDYAIRLASHFHAEFLLDREHYMDWLVSSLENSPQTKLPLWILITQIYWKDLLKYRKYGRRLSGAFLHHYAELLNHPDQDILAPLSDRLHRLIKSLMVSNPDGFVSPAVWTKHRDIIRSGLVSDDERFLAIFESIDRRNCRLGISGSGKEPTVRQRIIQLLDTTLSASPSDDLPKRCWQITDDKAMVLRVVLEWSTSLYRPGIPKTYVAARILRFGAKSGADVTDALLNFMDSETCEVGRNRLSFYHLVSELARSEHFSAARYFQWLIARGGLQDPADIAQDGPCAKRLLAELPTHNLSEGIASLHRALLERASFSLDEEEERMAGCMAAINRTLPTMPGSDSEMELDNPHMSDDIPSLISQLNRSSKSEIGLWLRHKVLLQMQQPKIPQLDDWDATSVKAATPAIATSDFQKIRYYLELIEDYSMLADVLKITASSSDAEVLATCTDTLNLHVDTLAAIGALQSLFDMLVARLRVLAQDQDSIPRVFLASLSDLASRMPNQKRLAQQLSQELVLCDRKNAVDACSPVSDHIAITQATEVDFIEETEKILSNGNSMDQATLDRLFQRVVSHLEISWHKSPDQQRCCVSLLARLRPFSTAHFDTLMSSWVTSFLHMHNRPSMFRVLGPFISSGCLSLSTIASCCTSFLGKAVSDDHSATRISRELLDLLIGTVNSEEVMDVGEAYRFRVKQSHMQKDSATDILTIIRRVLEEPPIPASDESNFPADDGSSLLENRNAWELLQRYALLYTDSVIQILATPLLRNSGSAGSASLSTLINKFLLGETREDDISTEEILDIADDLTLPFCQIQLDSMFGAEDSAMSGTDESVSARFQTFDSAIEAAVNSGKTAWASIVPLLDMSIAQHLRRRAELQFLALFPSPKSGNVLDCLTTGNHLAQAENLLRVIDSTAYSTSTTATVNPNNTSHALDILSTLNSIRLILSTNQTMQIKDALISKWIPLILSFIVLHTSEFEATKSGHENRAKVTLALSAVFLELQALDINTEPVSGLIQQTFDLALHLVDGLPDDVRQQCIRSLHDMVSNPQIRYLFSYSSNPSDWLVLSQKEKPSSIPGEAPRRRTAAEKEKIVPFRLRRWEMLGEPTPNIGENDTSLNLTLFGARRG